MKAKRKAKAKQSQPKMECAGDWVASNIWFKVGLTKTQAAALKAASERMLNPKWRRSAEAARLLLQTALAHYDVIEPLFFADVRYMRAEGFSDLRLVQEGKIKQLFVPVAPKRANR